MEPSVLPPPLPELPGQASSCGRKLTLSTQREVKSRRRVSAWTSWTDSRKHSEETERNYCTYILVLGRHTCHPYQNVSEWVQLRGRAPSNTADSVDTGTSIFLALDVKD
ncbi:hypothetical protein EYF80_004983 [Liparis tanakae]|uniref:Uncharacterized protein n=1 Tax=Liparis tanakae TaxID=230148 RepID=A0A4Z2J5K6_9TELE|nr:hypothetical protein EYF80_004983 [Liparis tanakae]